jgi:hypothetical protein
MNIHHLSLAFTIAVLLSFSSVEAREFKLVAYIVDADDTMDSIAHTYLPADRGTSHKAFAEFKEGIFEYNYDRVFIHRLPYEVRAGDCLFITFWE